MSSQDDKPCADHALLAHRKPGVHNLSCRVYSVRNMGEKKDLTVDMGAYRYNRKRMGIITDIIERLLKLPTRFYQVRR